MDFNAYQQTSRQTAKYPDQNNTFLYPMLGLTSEVGEVADKLKKYMRDQGVAVPGDLSDDQKAELKKELGDVLWYVAQLASELDLSLQDIAVGNVEKIESRIKRGQIGGSGDDR